MSISIGRSLVYKEIEAVSWSFYTLEEIRKLSAVKLTNPHSFTTEDNPTVNGCYDLRMGPLEPSAKCPTCGLRGFECPGHLGHIELMLPIYNPLLFRIMFKLLNCKCFKCHRFLATRESLKQFIDKCKTADNGDLLLSYEIEATQELVRNSLAASKRKKSKETKEKEKKNELQSLIEGEEEESFEEEEEEEEELLAEIETQEKPKSLPRFEFSSENYIDKVIQEFQANLTEKQKEKYKKIKEKRFLQLKTHSNKLKMLDEKVPQEVPIIRNYTTLIEKRRTEIFNEFFKLAKGKGKKCPNCSENIVGVKSDGRAKIFRKALGKSEEELNEIDISEFKDEEENESSEDLSNLMVGKKKKKTTRTSLDSKTSDGSKLKYLAPYEVREQIRQLWTHETEVLSVLFGAIHKSFGQPLQRVFSPDIFFLEALIVTSNKFRPANKVNGKSTEHPQNYYLNRILHLNHELVIENSSTEHDAKKKNDLILSYNLQIQHNVNFYFDNKDAPVSAKMPPGITQILEKKEGLFRRNMMGKRVNYAARTVISPDPFLDTNQIGVPDYFAKKLTFPQPVTAFNFQEMQQAVINGPYKHPGANFIEDERGNLYSLEKCNEDARKGLARTLLTYLEKNNAPHAIKVVHRHLRDGDIVLLNRQPTLHKPSMMGHFVKILYGEKTMRFHYANCATFNADFDGDEMNIHFPQNELARAEAIEITCSDNQYITARNGQPLRGLIQDHVGTGVLLTKRDIFFTKEETQQLVYSACLEINFHHPIELPIPAILKPVHLWTGKQIITIILNQITWGKPALNLDSKCKIPEDLWGNRSHEGSVIIKDNEFLLGILEKSQYGASAFGLVHACYELYGPKIAGQVLSILSRLFTLYLRDIGFTCGLDDMIMNSQAEIHRSKLIQKSQLVGQSVAAHYTEKKDPEEIFDVLQIQLRKESERAVMDTLMKQKLQPITSEIISNCIPHNQMKKFPENNLALMTVSGAKGSNVNFSQISCLLGQQELEGKRVPMMVSGKTLPCFDPFDTSPRAGGYISQRFLTGIKPQEYFFHCMAGREGLIDTAVKTSRSGYLQRCLIKHLEGLQVHYDYTVRDADGSVIQFNYGEDSLNVEKIKFMENLPFMASNYQALLHTHQPKQNQNEKENPEDTSVPKLQTKLAEQYHKEVESSKDLDPVLSRLNLSYHIGAVSEKFQNNLMKYIKDNPQALLKDNNHPKGLNKKKFKMIMYMKYHHSLVPPGEAVGLLAAQSIGEPSTQMTLNTFHLAGRGDVNVTLGIPRLREIIMTASKNISTPSMILDLKTPTFEAAQTFAKKAYKLVLPEIIEEVTVREYLKSEGGVRYRFYNVKMVFKPERSYEKFELDFPELYSILQSRFLASLSSTIRRTLKSKVGAKIGKADNLLSMKQGEEEKEDGRRSMENDEENLSVKRKVKRVEGIQYDEPEEEELKNKSRSGNEGFEQIEELDESERVGDQEEGEAKIIEKPSHKSQSRSKNQKESEMITEEGMEEGEEEGEEEAEKVDLPFFVEQESFDETEGIFNFSLKLPASGKKLLMIQLIESISSKFIVKSIPKINKCSVQRKEEKGKQPTFYIQTEGVNFHEIWKLRQYLNINNIGCNDIYAILQTYGVEAARNAIVQEIAGVFAVYGISVDYRHLSLIADYMTFDGDFRAMNRITMSYNTSPLQRMSFETTVSFIKNSALRGDIDNLRSPSAKIVIGQPVRHGTGAFDILSPLQYP